MMIPWQALMALSMSSAERTDESDILFLQEKQSIVKLSSQKQQQTDSGGEQKESTGTEKPLNKFLRKSV